jgi:hypothetical protein
MGRMRRDDLTVTFNPYTPDWHKEAPPEISLSEYAKAWIDMEPHIAQLAELASHAQTVVEFGIRGGVSTWAMLDGLPANGDLYGVDINDVRPQLPLRVRASAHFHFVLGDSLEVPLPDHADLVMIDSSHEFAQTVAELLRASKLGPKVIALHDYLYAPCNGTVQRAVDGFVGPGYLQEPAYRLSRVEPSKWGLAILERR